MHLFPLFWFLLLFSLKQTFESCLKCTLLLLPQTFKVLSHYTLLLFFIVLASLLHLHFIKIFILWRSRIQRSTFKNDKYFMRLFMKYEIFSFVNWILWWDFIKYLYSIYIYQVFFPMYIIYLSFCLYFLKILSVWICKLRTRVARFKNVWCGNMGRNKVSTSFDFPFCNTFYMVFCITVKENIKTFESQNKQNDDKLRLLEMPMFVLICPNIVYLTDV